MQIIIEPSVAERKQVFVRPQLEAKSLEQLVNKVFDDIKAGGDKALLHYVEQYDKVKTTGALVPVTEWSGNFDALPEALRLAILRAKENIECFHRAQVMPVTSIETMPGVTCWQEVRPIERVGIYIPGGTAPLFSTVLMLAIPAYIAGCREIVLCTPPGREGKIHPAILFAASVCGVTKIVAAGGIQAIAAMTYGTESVPRVDKIFGPGNQYVVAAKQAALREGIAVDLPAGPSEVMVVADDTAVPAFVAADLLSQAEHGADSQVICLVNNERTLNRVLEEVALQLEQLPRKAIAQAALDNSKLILLADRDSLLESINQYAPEHLILCTRDNNFYRKGLTNAGSVFMGNYTPESAGDYASGTNHTLPTNGYARAYSGVNMDAFVKKITFQEITQTGLQHIGPIIETMAIAEQLDGHANAITIRLNNK